MQKESLVSIRVRTAAPAWLCIFHYVKRKIYKLLLKIKLWVLQKLGLPVLYFLSLYTSFSGWSLGMQGSSVFTSLSGLLRPRWEGAQGEAPSTIQESPSSQSEQCKSLVRGFIGFLHKPRNISLFSVPYSLNWNFFFISLYIYIFLSTRCSHFGILDPTRTGPG